VSAANVLEMVRAMGVKLTGRNGRLQYEAPAGRLTPELKRALAANKAAILDLLEREWLAARCLHQCRDCIHFISSASVTRASGLTWEMPGGCTQGHTSPERRPPIYPFTGWFCDGWTGRQVH
jgi:TubC N-terminal docking domain